MTTRQPNWDLTSYQKVNGGVDVRFHEFDVRAGEGEALPAVYLFISEEVGDTVSMDWTLASADSQGVLDGHRDLVVGESSFDITAACDIDNPFD